MSGVMSDEMRQQVAWEAAVLLNEAIRELLIPQHLTALFEKLHDEGRVTERYAGAVSHTAMVSAILAIYRLREIRESFLVPWLFSELELSTLGLGPIEHFVGDWSAFVMVRGQYVGHARRRKASRKFPARIPPPRILGEALVKSGLWERQSFLGRVREELVPAVERVRDELFKRYPDAKSFVEVEYPTELQAAAERQQARPCST